MRYFIEFSYNGSAYFGYQIQPKVSTVQSVLEGSLSKLLRENLEITGAGRTDRGVHARKMYAHFDSNIEIKENFVHRLNCFLPCDISVNRIFVVRNDLHARFSALHRTYEYDISTEKDPFSKNFSWQLWRKNLNLEEMKKACNILLEYEDFTSFSKLHSDNKTNLCKVYKAFWERNENQLKFTICADRFLRNMVRAIVGTMVEIGLEKITLEDFRFIIEKKDRSAAKASAPACGLFLTDIAYEW